MNYYKNVLAGKSVAKPSVVDTADWATYTMALGSWGMTQTYNITFEHVGTKNDFKFFFYLKIPEHMALVYQIDNGPVQSVIGTSSPKFSVFENGITIERNKKTKIKISFIFDVGNAGFETTMQLQ